MSENIKYPKLASRNNIQGKVLSQFIVSKDGSIEDVVILKSLGYGCDEEVLRILSISPKWRPGIYKGKPVRVRYSMPIMLVLPN
ncbi:MAG: energy transducer TonB [Pseudarcicella sp.]|nr:energy transducer TonB [Pseudarcicella sp.]MBP6411009.1 energy transducer TonB [Pseudarcicella sp.]